MRFRRRHQPCDEDDGGKEGFLGSGEHNFDAGAIPLPVASLIAVLREAPNAMPSFSVDVLLNRGIADIHAYLSSLPGRRDAKDIPPILNQ
ncbi:mono/diheme cytochrome c family protein [Bradyrhizobium sp. USDA 4473]